MLIKIYSLKTFVSEVSCNGRSFAEIELTAQSIECNFLSIVHSCIFSVYFSKNTNLNQVLKILMPKHFFKYSFLILLMTIGLASCNQGSTENRDHLVFRYNQHANIKIGRASCRERVDNEEGG